MHLPVRIEDAPEKTLIGQRLTMSIAHNQTGRLWQGFVPRKQEIAHRADEVLYSVDVFPDLDYFRHFDPIRTFEKWAAVRVSTVADIPTGMEVLTLPAGPYAVFTYRGKGSEASQTYQYILGTWLPQSDYALDHRPHLALMDHRYQNESPDSEEELWIPIRR